MGNLLDIKNMRVSVEDNVILDGINMSMKNGEIHAVMGPNGAGKSTLAAGIVGNPVFNLDSGEIFFGGECINDLSVHERARKGIFLSFQTPEEIPGLRLEEFLRASKEAVSGEKVSIAKFHKELLAQMKDLEIPVEYAGRHLNVGFSGGEKKKSEILQLAMLKPKLAILDEADSGLDIDATRVVFEGVQKIRTSEMGVLIITHHNKVLDYLKPDVVHVIVDGKIIKTGDLSLAKYIESHGYANIRENL
ncbi:MAG: Fe-S cluster assembly ATPase SufC [Treponema sp.]|nr:MAG: Fe-S cluster assembly ATPase SufC [Treponema sp.]